MKTLENTEEAVKMNNTETLATWGTQDKKNKNKITTKYVLNTTIRKQTQIS